MKQTMTALDRYRGIERTTKKLVVQTRLVTVRAMSSVTARLLFSLILLTVCIPSLLALSACGESSTANGDKHVSETSGSEFALYALSRGKGVPEPTRGALENANSLLEDARQRGEVLALSKTRIGLEGEIRLCVQAKDAGAARDLQRKIRTIAEHVELFNIVEEPCSKK